MFDFFRFLYGLVADALRGHAALVAENALLRQQLIVARRKINGRVRFAPWQRLAMAMAARAVPMWRAVVVLVQRAADDDRSVAPRGSATFRSTTSGR